VNARERAWQKLTEQERASINRFQLLIDEEDLADLKKAHPPSPLDVTQAHSGKDRAARDADRFGNSTQEDPLTGVNT
jgi:hypothetical protein